MKFSIIAHRCGKDKFPELTIDAAKHSLSLGADCIELDLRLTADKVPVVSHDPDASRLFGNTKKIAEMAFAEFTKLTYLSDSNYRGIAFSDVLESNISPLLLHIKVGADEMEPIFTKIEEYKYQNKITMGVIKIDAIKLCKKRLPEAKVLAFMPTPDNILESIDSGADIIRLWEPWVSQEKIDFIHHHGKKVWVMSGHPNLGDVGITADENIYSWANMGADGVLLDNVIIGKRIANEITE